MIKLGVGQIQDENQILPNSKVVLVKLSFVNPSETEKLAVFLDHSDCHDFRISRVKRKGDEPGLVKNFESNTAYSFVLKPATKYSVVFSYNPITLPYLFPTLNVLTLEQNTFEKHIKGRLEEDVKLLLKFKNQMRESSSNKGKESVMKNFLVDLSTNPEAESPENLILLSKNYKFESVSMPITVNWFKRPVQLTRQKIEGGLSSLKGVYM